MSVRVESILESIHAENIEHLEQVQQALHYALTQVMCSKIYITERRLVVQEFWHSLNRKGIVRAEDVDKLIEGTYNPPYNYWK